MSSAKMTTTTTTTTWAKLNKVAENAYFSADGPSPSDSPFRPASTRPVTEEAAVTAASGRRRRRRIGPAGAKDGRVGIVMRAFGPLGLREREREREGHARCAAGGRGQSSQEVLLLLLKAELHLAVDDSRRGNGGVS